MAQVSIDVSRHPMQSVCLSFVFFSDALEDAFGTCAYARWQLSNGKYDVRFIAAKSRVAPLKRLTIPHLELQGAVLASRPWKIIVEQCRFKFEKTVLFLDSKIVLAWIMVERWKHGPKFLCLPEEEWPQDSSKLMLINPK